VSFPASKASTFAAALAVAAACLIGAAFAGAGTQERLDATESKIDRAESEGGVLSTEIEAFDDRIGVLEGKVAALRNREAAVEAELAVKQAELDEAVEVLGKAQDRLVALRARLRRSMAELRERLVAIYIAGNPDLVSVLLASDGFDDLVQRTEYLQRIQVQDESIVGRVRDLRNQTQNTVETLREAKEIIEEARDTIATRERELADTRGAIEGRQAELIGARGQRQAALDEVNSRVDHLEGIQADLQAEIQQQIAEATLGVSPLPAGPAGAPSAAGMIWPVDGILTSGFGYRWGSMHEGIDIAAPEGTPIRAAASGAVILAAYTGGYGNYTCLDHGGGLSTCYGHQSGFAVSSGSSVSQGDIIGYVGSTGHSTGPHLHFEVRVGGAAVDPLGYL